MPRTVPEGPEWVLQQDSIKGCAVAEQVRLAARETWPFVRNRALKALSNRPWIQDHLTFVSEIWEGILSATCVRIREDHVEIQDLRAYLVGAFIARLDEWTQTVWGLRRYGHSWKEIARVFGLDEEQTRLRYTYALDKIRTQVERSKHPRKD